jgi:response regulator RpfG family c-di-GMP phosphodiesterase
MPLDRKDEGVGYVFPSKSELVRLRAEIKHRGVVFTAMNTEFVKISVKRLSKLKGSRFAELRKECLEASLPVLFSAAEFEAALDACREMVEIGRLASRVDWMRLGESSAGAIENERGNVPEALSHHLLALDHARLLSDPAAEAKVLNNIGIAFAYAGLYRDALPCLIRATSIAPETIRERLLPMTYSNLAQAYLAMGDLDKALGAIERAIGVGKPPANAHDAASRTICEWTFVNVALERGDIKLASIHVDACEKFARQNGSDMSLFLSKLSNGLYEMHRGSAEKGLRVLEAAFVESEKYGDAQRVDAITSLVKAYELCSRSDLALAYMNRLMQYIADRRQRQLSVLLEAGMARERGMSDEYMDLHAWRYRHERLRTAAAQHEAGNARQDMLERLAITASLKEDASGEHGYRVGRLASLLAEDLGWPKDQCYMLDVAGRLHDIGKVGIPDRILLGSQELKDAERHFMRAHTTMGAELLAKSDVPQMKLAEEVARCHHEFWDGSGYPANLSGERIPLSARMVALADVFDALTHGRPYAAPWTIDDALAHIHRSAATQFDPALTERFIALVARLRQHHPDLDDYLGRAADESAFLSARRKLQSMLASEQLSIGNPL